jgi:hypothetical protein
VTLEVKRNTIQHRVFRRQKILVFQRQRLPLTESRWDLRWVIGCRTKPTFCAFPVISVAVMEKSCDACGDGEYYVRSGFLASKGAAVSEASIAVDRKSMGDTWLIGRRTKPTICVFFCVFPLICMAVMPKCCDVCGDEDF